MKTNQKKLTTILLGVAATVVTLGLVSCGSDEQTATYVQIERLARPGVNELFVYTNKSHAAYNSISPDLDTSEAAAPVLAEAATVLGYIDSLDGSANTPPLADVVSGFIPDVMRIDLAKASGYAAGGLSTTKKMLHTGRKLEDDVIAISYSYLASQLALALDDGVLYDGSTGNQTTCATAGAGGNAASPGHKCLHGQTARLGNATFPFVPRPN